MSDLVARLEAATEGSRELDVEIGRAARHAPKLSPVYRRGHYVGGEPVKLRDKEVWPPYTTSVDAALTLVPEGCCVWHIGQTEPGDHWEVRLRNGVSWLAIDDDVIAITPALALCIAALKARSL